MASSDAHSEHIRWRSSALTPADWQWCPGLHSPFPHELCMLVYWVSAPPQHLHCQSHPRTESKVAIWGDWNPFRLLLSHGWSERQWGRTTAVCPLHAQVHLPPYIKSAVTKPSGWEAAMISSKDFICKNSENRLQFPLLQLIPSHNWSLRSLSSTGQSRFPSLSTSDGTICFSGGGERTGDSEFQAWENWAFSCLALNSGRNYLFIVTIEHAGHKNQRLTWWGRGADEPRSHVRGWLHGYNSGKDGRKISSCPKVSLSLHQLHVWVISQKILSWCRPTSRWVCGQLRWLPWKEGPPYFICNFSLVQGFQRNGQCALSLLHHKEKNTDVISGAKARF